MGKLIGYARVSTDDQSIGLQVDDLIKAGVDPADIYSDVGVSGAKSKRPGLDAMLRVVAEGDTIVIWRLDRLGRSVLHLAQLGDELLGRGVGLRSLSDGVDTSTSVGKLLYGLLSVLAEFERETIRERVSAGMKAAKKRGSMLGRKRAMTTGQIQYARALRDDGKSFGEVAALLGCDKSTVYRSLTPSA